MPKSTTSDGAPNFARAAELIQADWAKVGVTAEIKSFEWGEYRKRMQNGEHQMGMLGWTGDNGDPDNFLHTLLGCDSAQTNGSNVAKFCFKPFEDLVIKAKSVTKQSERADLYRRAQLIFKEQAPWFTISHAVQLKPVRKEVVDFKLSPFGRHTFYGVDIKSGPDGPIVIEINDNPNLEHGVEDEADKQVWNHLTEWFVKRLNA